MNSQLDAEVRNLVLLRQGRGAAAAQPAIASFDDAYKVQAEVLRLLQERVGGWKVALGPEGIPVAAPLFASTILPSGSTIERAANMKIETELGFRLNRNLPAQQVLYTRRDILDAISTIQCVFEIIQPRLAGNNVPFFGMLADNLANGCTLLSTAAIPLGGDISDIEGTIIRDGAKIASGRHPTGDPLLPILHYANNPSDQLGGLRSGQIVITGSFTGAPPVDAPAEYLGAVGHLEPVGVRIR